MKKAPFFLSLFAGIIIILISIYGFFSLHQRPGLPPIDKIFPERQLEMSIKNIIQEDNLEIQIDGINIKRVMDIEFIMSQKTIGDWVILSLKVNDKIKEKEVQLIPYYSQIPFPFIYLLIGLFSFAIGVVVFFLRAGDIRARIFSCGF